MRNILKLCLQDERMVGTLHGDPRALRGATLALLPNFGWVPRDGQGRLSIKVAETFCASGIPALRVDLPGLGESPGTHPEKVEEFGRWIQQGRQSAHFSLLVRHLQENLGVARFLVAGICSPFTTAAFAWQENPFPLAGIVALDPEFFTSLGMENQRGSLPLESASLARRLTSEWGWMRVLGGESRWGRRIPFAKAIARRLALRPNHFPENANMPLVAIWRRMVEQGIPALMICAEGKIRHLYAQQINAVALRDLGSDHVRFLTVPMANHIFTCGNSHEIILGEIREWLSAVHRHERKGESE